MEDFGQKKCSFGSKTVRIAYYTELNVQFCNYAQKRRICRQNSKYASVKNFCGHFCRRREAANYCHPGSNKQKKQTKAYWHRCAVCVVCAGRKGVGYKCEHAAFGGFIRWWLRTSQPTVPRVCLLRLCHKSRRTPNGQKKGWNIKQKWR